MKYQFKKLGGGVCIIEDLDNLLSEDALYLTNPSEEGRGFTHVYSN